MNKKNKVLSLILCPLLVAACTAPGERTGVGAATGGVIGAGLGAIVGNQTGSAGSGLVIGAVAGAAAGAAVGNALQAQDEALRTQDEAIERQDQIIKAQGHQLANYKKEANASADATEFRSWSQRPRQAQINSKYLNMPAPKESFAPRSLNFRDKASSGNSARASYNWSGKASRSSYHERDIAPKANVAKPQPEIVKEMPQTIAEPSNREIAPAGSEYGSVNLRAKLEQTSAQCRAGLSEAKKGEQSNEAAEKLFHLRRALRLCPEEPAFHNSLGEVYLSLGRRDDASFEFKEALRLDPQSAAAQRNMDSLGSQKRL